SDAIMYRIMHAAPDISAVPPGLSPLVEAALAKDPQARPTASQLLGQLTGTAARYDNPTQTILAQNWHAPVPLTGPPGPVPGPTGPAGPGGPRRSSRRRGALLPVVLVLAFVLAAGGTALGLSLAGKHSNGNAASSGTSAPASSSQPATASSTATTPASTP